MIKDLFDLFFTFFKIGAITFGGGLAMLPILERELADKRKWTTGEELLDYYAIAQSTPGIIAVNVATFVGYKRRKTLGGIVATVGVVTPSLIIITIIAKFIANFEDIIWVQKALKGINVAVAALLTYSAINFAKKTIKVWWNAVFYVFSFCAIYFFKISPVFVVIVAASCGIIMYFVQKKKTGGSADDSAKKSGGSDEQNKDSVKENEGGAK